MRIISPVRRAIAAFVFSFLFIFFAPIVPYKILNDCAALPGCLVTSPHVAYFTGYNSIGLTVFKWGATWSSYLSRYSTPRMVINLSGTASVLTASEALLFLVLPLSLLAIALISQDIVSGVRHLKSNPKRMEGTLSLDQSLICSEVARLGENLHD